MKTLTKIIGATVLAATTATSFSVPADARTRHRHHYYGRTYYRHKVCRYSSGTTGLVAGGVAGGIVGHSVIGGGLAGTAVGAVGGALAGRAIDRASTARRRCYYTR
jgi:outer membrane lipoprotein SlyB